MSDAGDYTGNWEKLQDRKRLVRESYNAIAPDYLASRTAGTADVKLLDEFLPMLAPGALVLDAGCGAGKPITQLLEQRCRVVGVDFAEAQLVLACRLVPDAVFVCQDLTDLAFARNSFDAVCSYYAIIHIPREEHRPLLKRIRDVLKPGGLALLCLGANDLPPDFDDDYFGSLMHWSHYDASTNLSMLRDCDLQIIWSRLVPDSHSPDASHLFVLAQKPT